MLAAHFHECLVSTLDDALATDVNPRAGCHLAEHHQALPVELAEVLPVRPRRDEIGIGNQDARRIRVRFEYAYRLARLHQQCLVARKPSERRDDGVEAIPVAGRLADAAVNHQVFRSLRDFRVEIVHDHAQRRLGQPAFRLETRAGWRFDPAWAFLIHRFPLRHD
jgi:hypothetical protein